MIPEPTGEDEWYARFIVVNKWLNAAASKYARFIVVDVCPVIHQGTDG